MKTAFYLALVIAWIPGVSIADISSLDSIFYSANKENSSGDRTTENSQYSNYYLVSHAEPYSGDTLSFGQRQYQLSRDDKKSSGQYYLFGNFLLLWNSQERSYDLVNIEAVEPGVWKSCWGQDIENVGSCSRNTELYYIFGSKSDAINFNDEKIAIGPVPEPVQPESAPEPVEPEPVPEPVEPDPVPESVEPEPVPEPVEPEPIPQPVQQEPESTPAQPQPDNVPTQSGNAADVNCSAPPEELKAAILKATNDSRSTARQCGATTYSAAGPLVWNNSLAAAAIKHSNDMASNNFFNHSGSDGLQVWDRADAENYQYSYIGENIAAGQDTVENVQSDWIDSPGHCSNIMNPQITEMGAACIIDPNSDYDSYWTVVVGKRR